MISFHLLELKLPFEPGCSSVGLLICQFNFLKGQKALLPCFYRSTCLLTISYIERSASSNESSGASMDNGGAIIGGMNHSGMNINSISSTYATKRPSIRIRPTRLVKEHRNLWQTNRPTNQTTGRPMRVKGCYTSHNPKKILLQKWILPNIDTLTN